MSPEKHADELLARIRVHGAIPRHVAIIMDGNGRWARERLLPRPLGHRSGMQSVRAVVKGALALGVEWLSLFAFSQENWQRPATEVGALMSLLEEYIAREVDELREKGVRVRVLGDLERLTPAAAAAVDRVIRDTAHNDRLTLNLFISYGSRAEIVRAARLLARDVAEGRMSPDDIDEEAIAARLYTADCPDPDLLIRTSGELRVSNFLLWQIAYTELYISDVLWPDFGRRELYEAVLAFQGRERRFGRVSA
ncbi:Undecaprenyl pyrophosphate synthase [Gemmatirosa kalamazoonensis]|uniref:Isoprenyl transferase n=1 Tax=Gemmatirosa kalamazoonensis TaxID=861299 RepID=W0RKU1_9BACT|nr:isoprenyl transferase [Gemmatirosa kalamazoonensis]AHG90945.1 Undecaprenyl pyrophosphate synthase [Gemmatirosa kalamazoonensis]